MPIFGSVVTGSNNFTENGLNAQYEFNVELKDTPDVKYALENLNNYGNRQFRFHKIILKLLKQKLG